MKRTTILAVLLAASCTARSQVVPNFDWVKNYSEQGSITDVPSAIDGDDNVIVTGYVTTTSNDNIVVLKYDSNGNLLWTAHYDNGGNDRPRAVTTDTSGNIYVTGPSQGTGTGNDYVTIKFNSSGTQQWAARYNGPSNQADVSTSIVVDGSGNVYVTGASKSTTGLDCATIKYNSSGTQQWAYRYNSASNLDDGGIAIALDGSGNLFVTGQTKNSTTLFNILTLKINGSTGANIWTSSINGTANGDDQPYDMLLYAGDPIIVGKIKNTTTNDDYFVARLNSSTGATTWSYTYDGYGQNDVATSIAQDTSGYIMLTGIAPTSGSALQYHTIKMGNTGSLIWTHIEPINITGTYDVTPKIVCDFVNHMYVLGQKANTNSDIYVYQLTPSGNKTWSRTHDGAAGNTDAGVDFLVNSYGQLLMVGETYNLGAKWDFTTIKISQTPVVFPPDSEAVGSLKFFPNLGQVYDTDDSLLTDVEYYNNSEYPNTYIKKNRLSYVLHHIDTSNSTNDTMQRIDVTLAQTNGLTEIYNFEVNDPKFHFFYGDLNNGITNVQGSNRLLIPNIYPGIDLHYYSSGSGLKMYWVIKPWASPTDIQLTFSGHSSLALSSGNLNIGSILETITWDDPQYFQVDTCAACSTGYVINPVSGGAFTLSGSTVSFNSPTYDHTLPLIIQVDRGDAPPPPPSSPEGNLYWSTYVGYGENDQYIRVRKDSNENILACGYSLSTNFPTTTGALTGINFSGGQKGIFSKYDHTNGKMLFSTYLGSQFSSIATDARGIDSNDDTLVYVVGNCGGGSPFAPPLPNATGGNYQKTTSSGGDAYIMRFNPYSTPPAVEYFTYFGGSDGNEIPYAFGIDHAPGWGRLYIGGLTSSSDMLVTHSVPSTWNSNASYYLGTGFILEMSLTGDTLYSTYYPGIPKSVAVEDPYLFWFGDIHSHDAGNLPIAGNIYTYNDSTYNGGTQDVFLTQMSIPTPYIQYSSYFGGTDSDVAQDIAMKDTVVSLVGFTSSSDFTPLANTGTYYDSTYAGGPEDMFIMKFGAGAKLRWSTYYGGNNPDHALGVAFGNHYNLFIGGYTESWNGSFGELAYGPAYSTTPSDGWNGYVLGFDNYNQKFWNTSFGGETDGMTYTAHGTDAVASMIVTSDNKLFIGGSTDSDQLFPLLDWVTGTSYFDATWNDKADAIMAMFSLTGFPTAINEMNDLQTNGTIGIYPNPNDGSFSLVFAEDLEKASISVYSELGALVYTEKPSYLNANSPHRLEINHLSTGMYYIYVSSVKGVQTAKFIVR